ncbi:FKBP-type peptidyl-prolyl cis-trans isomerase [Nocardioides acrostichi]|uniref:peptidylprolyl isomerase n=1 Tax=Nocardioides acrostichi TaxID=2784339 RepID=A0A930V598_9ACTN|nr:FKBP-type peptidyl-prolyl cis-trans isomerase [Nocardioides acrostichi]MBF4163429.1 FKBP-type peptidyl-prolyl cis-trans isomerase [Nocardioides acrostichi]
MPRRLHRPAAALALTVLLSPALVACGGDSSDSAKDDASSSASASSGSLDGVSFTGDVGKEITPKWEDEVKAPTTPKATTLVEGSGEEIASGDTVSTYLWIGDGTTKKAAYSDYDQGTAEPIPVSDQLPDVLGQLFDGATYGSRVAIVAPASTLFGTSGNSQMGVGADDSLVIVADLVKKAPTSPTPSDSKVHNAPASTQPTVVEKNGQPTGLDFSGISKPKLTTPVQRVVLKQGSGPAVKATDTVTVNYLGETYQAKAPFDESYSKGQPLTQPLSGLVQGWGIGLTGVKVGSRVLLQMPPAFGYGAQGSGSTIPGNATLWFVIDVVKAQ